MLRCPSLWLSKRTPGYVFWRQSSLTELEHSKRNYLLSERPVPLGEISRRMARVKSRYEDTRDFHERNLLRGEYKYFTGKLCDLRAARLGDMVVVLQCAAFFGFWDAAQVDQILAELFLQLEGMEAVELVALFACMPQLRRQESELYRRVAMELVPLVPDLTTEECLAVCRACTAETPPELTEPVLRDLTEHLEEISPAQCVEVLDTWSVLPAAAQRRVRDVMEPVRQRALCHLEELECMDIAVLFTCLQGAVSVGGADPILSEALQRRLLKAFVRDISRACPRSTAMLFSAVRGTHSLALELAQQMADRALFLSTDFTPAELLAVFRVYVEGLVSLSALSAELRTPALPAGTASRVDVTAALHGSLSSAALLTSPLSLSSPSAARQRVLEMEQAAQSLSTLQRVGDALSAQLVEMLDSASAYLSVASQLEIVALYVDAVEQLAMGGTMGGGDTCGGSGRDATAHLLQLLPQSRRALQLVSSKLIANMKSLSLAELLQLLEQANTLGSAAVQDAAVAAAVQELITRDIDGLTTESALALEQRLRALTELRAEHQRRLSTALIPKVRRLV
ncbi:conserved hypothetical protein [Leishmania major strain Friedlin]|uniref:Mitochondrial RNA binding complex 1 subunit n=1 Tax=Leishmania major TaxID=5664 RepID=Q4QEL5_LEIMA|nr:conserved hypothetical protein [Leishmania major strain Friedlin]CAG9572194.1 hypothetical_protein_-_conserved [Leishmania major strain Friedlin]CAJ04134.1 conserved hypothetical protein [Leishmania major strain Friedlin]|eukprot:XP_001682233.1 conserved hypothetical protein [Leishmania major strain Friedlin]